MLLRKYVISLVLSAAFISPVAFAQEAALPIIDIHLHSYDADSYYSMPDRFGTAASATVEGHFDETYRLMRENNIVLGVVSGNRRSVTQWIEKDVDGRLIAGSSVSARRPEWTPEAFEKAVKNREVQVFGEIGAYYDGKTLDDPLYAPYLEICEKYGIPVAIHTGGGPPRITYNGAPDARLVVGNPLLLENVLNKYPKLIIYMMHSGEFYYREALRMMLAYPRLYSDLGVILWVDPLPKYYGEQFLRLAQKFGLLKRVMFGSDQMVWPHAIDLSLKRLGSFAFLTQEEKRDILYNNAARFLKLDQATIGKHHAGK